MEKNSKIYIAGHKGMVGSAIWRALTVEGYTNLIGAASADLDLRDQIAVQTFFSEEQPEIVIDAAARVGGILANMTAPYEFLMQNLQIQNNLIDTALRSNVSQFVFLGSSCIYPKMATQPLKEEYLLTDSLEPTNEWYAIAKIAGVKACEAIQKQYGKAFFSLMPTNLYGSYDNFDLNSSHVLPAMIRKFHEAKINNSPSVGLWGSGTPLREFLYVDDLAAAVVFALENNMTESFYNVGTGTDLSIKDLAETIKRIVGYTGTITWDASKPDGTPRKLMDVSKMNEMGWKAHVDLETGIQKTYEWYLNNQETVQQRNN
ncbi:GDP-L-fucose synthase family protein [Flavobacterium turcicum]|uniref:GDP-L-fucose synthase n=1 Tax=Flavobacterium turcicum TaxID=2764718 RepID=A0ABR7JI87_9FLAO|nr:GDP-L-fucose synthase [Flavobacterium turcicum]MBC5864212.1 GDP-L-fucose synthase [Flavobacterium turcicum]NHL03120.1 GDP-L-fucose synthase [Flavobacterium turcicum]